MAINKVYTCKVQISTKISPSTKTRVTADVIECRVCVRAYSSSGVVQDQAKLCCATERFVDQRANAVPHDPASA